MYIYTTNPAHIFFSLWRAHRIFTDISYLGRAHTFIHRFSSVFSRNTASTPSNDYFCCIVYVYLLEWCATIWIDVIYLNVFNTIFRLINPIKWHLHIIRAETNENPFISPQCLDTHSHNAIITHISIKYIQPFTWLDAIFNCDQYHSWYRNLFVTEWHGLSVFGVFKCSIYYDEICWNKWIEWMQHYKRILTCLYTDKTTINDLKHIWSMNWY